MPNNDLQRDWKTLTAVFYVMGAVALGLMSTFIGLWLGITPEEACVPVGVAAIVVTIAGGIYAAHGLGRHVETGPLAQQSQNIRNMAGIDMIVAIALIAYPYFP